MSKNKNEISEDKAISMMAVSSVVGNLSFILDNLVIILKRSGDNDYDLIIKKLQELSTEVWLTKNVINDEWIEGDKKND